MSAMRLSIKQLTDDVSLPRFAYSGDAGFDLCSCKNVVLSPFERQLIPCGIAVEIPSGYAGLIVPRSGLALKHGISIVNAPGLIDSGYRGEIGVILINLDPKESFNIIKGDRIAQMVIVATPSVELVEVASLSCTDRGEGGFGSSGISVSPSS